jgi:hypothetical protein
VASGRNFSRRRLCSLLEESGFAPLQHSVSERYRVCMEVIVRRADEARESRAQQAASGNEA